MARYRNLYFGGFFDHLHRGHLEAFRFIGHFPSDCLVVLVASDLRVEERKKRNFRLTEDQETRVKNVRTALRKLKIPKFRVELFHRWPPEQLLERIGSRDAVVLDSKHLNRQADFNEPRKSAGKPPLRVIPFDYIKVGISSQLIRQRLAKRSRTKRIVSTRRFKPASRGKRSVPIRHR